MKESRVKIFESLSFFHERFEDALFELYSNIKCECYIEKYNNTIKTVLLKELEKDIEGSKEYVKIFDGPHWSDEKSYKSMGKGVICLWNQNEKDAYEYLSDAINKNKYSALLYSLRSTIDPVINPDFLEDAKLAVLLKPSPYNYSSLVNAFVKENKFEDELITEFIDIIIESAPDCGCAFFKRGELSEKNHQFIEALEWFKKGLLIDPNNFDIIQKLPSLLNLFEFYSESITYTKLILEKNPNDYKFYLLLADSYYYLGELDMCRRYFEIFLEKIPNINSNRSEISLTKSRLGLCYEEMAEKCYEDEHYNEAINFFELSFPLKDETIVNDTYILSILKNYNKNIVIGQENELFIKLDKTINTWKRPSEFSEILKKDIDNEKSICYYYPSNIFAFGKHAGKDIASVLLEDPKYILRLIMKKDHFHVTPEVIVNQKLKELPGYIKALEINYIKGILGAKYMIEHWENKYCRDKEFTERDMIREMEGDWGGLYNHEAETGYLNTE